MAEIGVDLSEVWRKNYRPIHLAAQTGNAKILSILIQNQR
jgi:hypothetical protein